MTVLSLHGIFYKPYGDISFHDVGLYLAQMLEMNTALNKTFRARNELLCMKQNKYTIRHIPVVIR